MDVECEVCRGTNFYTRDGLTYCSRCNSESRAHGFETVVDEETIGTFQSGIAASLKKSIRKHSKSRKSQKSRSSKYLVSFTSTDAFTFILKGWAQDLIRLGAPPSTLDTVKLLWCNYLKKTGLCFGVNKEGDPINESSIGKYPSYRDLQTKITGRKKLIGAGNVGKFMKNRLKMTKREQFKIAQSQGSDDEDKIDELEIRRRRRQRRRQFINSLVDDKKLASDTTDLSKMSTSVESSSFRKDDFSVSFSNMDPSSGSEMDFSLNSSCASSICGLSSDDTESGLSTDEDNDERKESEMAVLANLKTDKRTPDVGFRGPRIEIPRIRTLFALLGLAVTMTEDNCITLTDMIYWANRNRISFKTCIRHLPAVMRLRSLQDVTQFTPMKIEETPLDHFKVRQDITRLGSLLKLKEAIFGSQSLEIVIQRFLKEFSLPSTILRVLKKCFKNLNLLTAPKFVFPEKLPKDEMNATPFFSLEIVALAFILFALKFIYGLDDRSELYRSADARKYNQDNPTKRRFVICDWIEKSRRRIFLCVRFCDDLHQRFKSLFPRVERSHTTLRQSFAFLDKTVGQMKQDPIGETEEEELIRNRGCRKGDVARLQTVSDFIRQSFDFSTRQLAETNLDVSKSLTPLHEMSQHFIATKDHKDCELDADEIKVLTDLLEMNGSKIGTTKVHPAKTICSNYTDTILDSEEVTIEGDWVLDYFHTQTSLKDGKSQMTYSQKPEEPPQVEHAKYYRFSAPYWRFTGRQKTRLTSEMRQSPANEDLVSAFPENFGWILKYFSVYSGSKPADIYNELCQIESRILESDPKFFGIGLKSKQFITARTPLWAAASHNLS